MFPPISTFFSGFLACCVNFEGAVFINSRAKPRGILTLSPSTLAPASFQRCNAFGFSGKFTPISSRTVSALYSITFNASSFKTSKFGIFRSIYFAVSITTAALSARRAAPPPPRALLRVVLCSATSDMILILYKLDIMISFYW